MTVYVDAARNACQLAHWTSTLPYIVCEDALPWLLTQPDAQTAWDKCTRGDWMLYHIGKLVGAPGSDTRHLLVHAVLDAFAAFTRSNHTVFAAAYAVFAAATIDIRAITFGSLLPNLDRYDVDAKMLARCADIIRQFFPIVPQAPHRI